MTKVYIVDRATDRVIDIIPDEVWMKLGLNTVIDLYGLDNLDWIKDNYENYKDRLLRYKVVL